MKILTGARCSIAIALALLAASSLAQQGTSDSLLAAQRRITATLKDLGKAKADVKRQETRVAEAEAALVRSQRKVDDDKVKLEQARKNLEEVRSSAAATQRNYDEATAEIQRLYRERQPASYPKP